MASGAVTPPPGFEIEQPEQQQVTPPAGFELETKPPEEDQDVGSTGFESYGQVLQTPEGRAAQTQTLKGLAPGAVGGVVSSLGGPLLGGAAYAATKGLISPEEVAAHPVSTALETASFPAFEYGTKAIGGALGKVADYFSGTGIQNSIKQTLRGILGTVAEENGVAVPTKSSARSMVEETADAVNAKSKAQYAAIDKATGGRFQRFADALKRIDRQIHEVADIDPDREGALLERRNQIQDAMNKTFEDAKAAGVDANAVNEANANFKKSMALYDVDRAVKSSTTGVEPATAEKVDPTKLSHRLEKLYDSGRLQEAVGEERAQAMLKESHAAEVRIKNLGKAKKAAVGAAGIVGTGAVGGATVAGIKKALE